MAPPRTLKTISKTNQLPDAARGTALELAAVAIPEGTWMYTDAHPLVENSTKKLQVRNIKELAPVNEVAAYAEVMRPFTPAGRRGNLTMPPMVFTLDGYLVDGNTRDAACRKLGWNEFPAFIIKFNWENAPKPVRDQILALAAWLNQKHGRKLSGDDLEALILQRIGTEENPSIADIARAMQCSHTTVGNIVKARNVRARFTEMEITADHPNLTRSHLVSFGNALDKFKNEPLKAYVQLVCDRKVATNDMNRLTARFAACPTEAATMAAIAEESRLREPVSSGNAVTTSTSHQAQAHLDWILARDAGELINVHPEGREARLQLLRGVAAQVRSAIYQQENLPNPGGGSPLRAFFKGPEAADA